MLSYAALLQSNKMDNMSLNIIAIVIGILLLRLIIVWMSVVRRYSESRVGKDLDQQETDYSLFKKEAVSSLIVTIVTIYVIIIIVAYYSSSLT